MAGSRKGNRRADNSVALGNYARKIGLPQLSLEEQFSLFVACYAYSPAGMAFIDKDFVIRFANQTFARQMGVPLDQMIGRPGEEVVPSWQEQVGFAYQRVRETGHSFTAETLPFVFASQPARGITFWDSSLSPVYGPDGSFMGYLLFQREVTERVHAEQEVSRLAAIVESSDDAIVSKTPDGIISSWNRAAERLYGYSAAEAKGKPISIIIPSDRAEELAKITERIERGETVEHFETVRITKAGRRLDVSISISPIQDASGNIIGASAISRDITGRKRSEAELRKAREELEARIQERTAQLAQANEQLRLEVTERQRADEERERLFKQLQVINQQLVVSNLQTREQAEVVRRRAQELETVLQSIADGVFLIGKDGSIAEVNKAGLRLIGLKTKTEALQHLDDYLSLLNLRYPDGRPIAKEELALHRALHGETVVTYEEIARSLQTHNDIYLLVSAAPVRDQEGNIVGAVEVMSDITEIRELDKLKDEFISIAAHELRTPVAIMKGYAQSLQRTAEELSEPRRKMLDAIDRGSDRISSIVQDLLDISRIHMGQLEMMMEEKVDLTVLAEDVVNRTALTATKHHIQVVKAEPVVVRGDRQRLELVLSNLIDNAVRYSPQGGNIDVAVTVQGPEAIVSVTDQGVGIPKEKQKHIFERFYRAHTGTPYDFGGMGVGLYISREVILKHGGRMWFESGEGKGTTFYFGLPLEQPGEQTS